jgi:hypothetical protein
VSGKKALIITDGSESIQLIARFISDALAGYKVKICPADKFTGTALLPADVFFIGCEKPNPASFAYLEEMLSHINLVSRKCGIFSIKEKTLNYLRSIIKDSEAGLGELLPAANSEVNKSAVKKWLEGLLK